MPATDNDMAKFLFAILRQKDLKDIDWNKVASDPILPKPISNGHAARMRYSRFRSSMLGHEPNQRRNRATPTARANRVSKKKVEKPIKSEEGSESPNLDGGGDSLRASSVPSFGEDPMFIEPSRSTTAPSTGAHHQARVHMRLLTPCSDSDHLATPHGYSPSPVGNEVQAAVGTTPFDFNGTGTPAHQEQIDEWQFSNFAAEYDMTSYASAGFNNHVEDALGMHSALMEQGRSQIHGAMVKHEEWDNTTGVEGQHYQRPGHC
ncbi:hypothetical protein V8F06_002554 [Rhypophila decipiens]